MGKKLKTGKARKDKYYHLAKETGYRSRAAFKLLQLNRKFGFLEKSRVCVDLCAAPGGWLQVATQHMPMSSVIIGIDLVPIKPIHNAITFAEDITTEKCRQALKKELQTWKADVFLHDGSPNVGQNWLHDAFQQAQLTLQAMKLATEFLRKGGWFVTKVFRSKDYNALLHVFGQLFKSVHSTKPQASRLESAEIFVVCRGFKAPAQIDPALVDPKQVFRDTEAVLKHAINLLHPEKRKKTVEGYEDGDYLLHSKLSATEFVQAENFHQLLATASEIVLDDLRFESHPKTTVEIRQCIQDIKVLGKKELISLLKWRKEMVKYLTAQKEKLTKQTEDMEVTQNEEEDEEEKVEKQIAQIKEEKAKTLKLKDKKERKKRNKLQERLGMKMVLPGDSVDLADDVMLFDLNKIISKQQLTRVTERADDDIDDLPGSDDENNCSEQPKLGIGKYKTKSVLVERFEDDDEEQLEFSSNATSDVEDYVGNFDSTGYRDTDSYRDEDTVEKNPLIVSMLSSNESQVKKHSDLWFSKNAFTGLDDEDAAYDDTEVANKDGNKLQKVTAEQKKAVALSRLADSDDDNSVKDSDDSNSDSDDSGKSGGDSVNSYDISALVNNGRNGGAAMFSNKRKTKDDDFEVVPIGGMVKKSSRKLNPWEMAVGEELIRSDKRRREIIEASYNRNTWNADENVPDWFAKDEARHYRKQIPVTKEQVQRYKEKQKLIDARPIKKVMEAEARKKKKLMKKMEKARKKAESISENVDVSEREKWKQIKEVYKKAGLTKKKKEEVSYVVARKGSTSGRKVRRPPGVQGRFRVVDPRMKKERKLMEKKGKGKKGNGKSRRR